MALDWSNKTKYVYPDANRFQVIEEARRNLLRTENTLEEMKNRLKRARARKDFEDILFYEKQVKHWVNRRDARKEMLENEIKEQDMRGR